MWHYVFIGLQDPKAAYPLPGLLAYHSHRMGFTDIGTST